MNDNVERLKTVEEKLSAYAKMAGVVQSMVT